MVKVKTTALKIISIILSITAICSSVFTVNAAVIPKDEAAPCYVTINSLSSYIEISGIQAKCNAELSSDYSTSLSIVMELQKKKSDGYETVETWSASKTGRNLSLSETRVINRLCSYRLKVTFKADKESPITYKYPA